MVDTLYRALIALAKLNANRLQEKTFSCKKKYRKYPTLVPSWYWRNERNMVLLIILLSEINSTKKNYQPSQHSIIMYTVNQLKVKSSVIVQNYF